MKNSVKRSTVLKRIGAIQLEMILRLKHQQHDNMHINSTMTCTTDITCA
jgi:hypothetical protein